MLISQVKSPIPRWKSVTGSWHHLSHMVWEQRSGLPKNNCNAIIRERDESWDGVGGDEGGRCPPMIVF